MTRLCEGRVCIVTGAGRGIGREHALSLAREGARLVINDFGASREGSGPSSAPAQAVAEEVIGLGAEAVVNLDDVSDWTSAERLIAQAVETYGRLDALVNNAGILRDRTIVNMTEQEWDSVTKVHLNGTFAPLHFAAIHWRARTRAGEELDARIINTTSPSGLFGNIGQANYGAAKAAIATLTIIAADELARYGVTVNAIAPVALTRLTEDLAIADTTADARERLSPRWVAPLVSWLVSSESSGITGRIFGISGHSMFVGEGWHRGPKVEPTLDCSLIGPRVEQILTYARPNADMYGNDRVKA